MGEYSGFFNNLKNGLIKEGHYVKLVANGDGWKQIDGADMPLYKDARDYRGILNSIKEYNGYDIVQIINPYIYKHIINQIALRKIKSQNERICMSAAGDDANVYKMYLSGKYKYYVYDENPDIDKIYNPKSIRGKLIYLDDYLVSTMVDAIIPTNYEYAEAYRKFKKVKKTIPMPVDYENILYQENKVKNKIVFFHGINRIEAKGSYYIIEAMKTIQERYPNDVEIIINSRMPLNEYLEAMNKVNVVLDQCKGYGLGMNALYAMSQGKIVMGGNEPESAIELGTENPPVYNIIPDKDQIMREMETIIENKKVITDLGEKSRKYIEKYHDCRKIARQYINVWNSI